MNRRRALAFAGILAVPLFALGAACTFPDVTFGNADAGMDATTTISPEAANDFDGEFTTDPDAQSAFDGVVPDPVMRMDPPKDPSQCGDAAPCDCDGDGYKSIDCLPDAGADAMLKDGDCDDLDSLRHPNSGLVAEVPDANAPKPLGDWNCNKVEEPTPPRALKCAAPSVVTTPIGLVLSVTCNGADVQGFINTPTCGQPANDLYKCPSGAAPNKQVTDCDPQPTGLQAIEQCQ